jgi:predicted lactoylglutathione lyase
MQIFVNLPVKDLKKSTDFFGALGFQPEPKFSDEKAGCFKVSENIYAMLLTEPFFKNFTKKAVADATKSTEAIIALGVENRQKVDELVQKALGAGGQVSNETMEEGLMYSRSFQDPDGHLWEVMYMDQGATAG